jgi:hypothetical protein
MNRFELKTIIREEVRKIVSEGPAINDPKIEKLVKQINDLIASAVDSDGDPIGVVDSTSTWEEPYVYKPIEYKNGALKITSYSLYNQNKPETEIIKKSNMQMDGIPTLKNIIKMYNSAIKRQKSV